jgi:4'-phosphopantetheinyl transferase
MSTCAWPDWQPTLDQPALEWTLREAQVDVWRIALNDPGYNWDTARDVLSTEEHLRGASYKRPVDRDRFLRTRTALRLLLARYCKLEPQRLAWQILPHGKPHLDPDCGTDPIEFNVSHSGEIALVAISRLPVGIDIEQLRSHVSCMAIARRYFSTREVRQLEALDERDRPQAFFTCWTRKEAFVKATGKGISSGLASFSVTLLPDAPAELVQLPVGADANWRLVDLSPAEGYAAALAVKETDATDLCYRNWPPVSW